MVFRLRTYWPGHIVALASDISPIHANQTILKTARPSASQIRHSHSLGCFSQRASFIACFHGNRALQCNYSGQRRGLSSQPRSNCPSCGAMESLAPLSATSAFLHCTSCRKFFINKSALPADEQEEASERAAAQALLEIVKNKRIPYPKEIVAHLDQYVIGQESAKRLLSVQAYAHYRRLQHNLLDGKNAEMRPTKAQLQQLDALEDAEFLSGLMKRQQLPFGAVKSKFQSFKDILWSIISFASPVAQAPQQQHQQPSSSTSPPAHVRLLKSNVLLIGPSGSGKSLLVQSLAKLLDVPFAACSCAGLAQTGYSGAGVDSVIAGLLAAAGGCAGRAQIGVVFLDEIDKLASKSWLNSASAADVGDIGGVGVQRELLRLLDGAEIGVSAGPQAQSAPVRVDTTDILFVASGTFAGLSNIVRRREKLAGSDFAMGRRLSSSGIADLGDADYDKDEAVLARAEPSDLAEFGLLPELVGRFPAVGRLNSLRPDELARVLTEPRDALARQFDRLLAADGCRLVLEPGAARAIGEAAARRGLGARGLRSIFEALLVNARFEAPGCGQPSEVRLTADCCRGLTGEDDEGLPLRLLASEEKFNGG